MKILSIGSDRSLLQEHSSARQRIGEYGTLVDELHIIVFSKRDRSRKDQRIKIAENVFVYPTNSASRWLYVFDAHMIGKRLMKSMLLKKEDMVITAQDPFECGVVGWLLARKFCMPLQLQIHTDLFSPYFARESTINTFRVMIARFLLPHATYVRAVSERVRRSLAVGAPTVVLPIFVDVQKIRDGAVVTDLRKKYPQFDFIALMASRFTQEKNIPMAIAAMKDVVVKHPSAGLIIVGDGPERKGYEALITQYRLKKNVIVEEWTDDLASYYKTADVFVLSSNYEGYGRTAIEAEAAGCPVIMTDVGVAGDVVKHGENGLIVPVRGVQTLAEAICSMIEKKVAVRASLPVQLSKEAYLEAYKQTWERCIIK